MAARKADNGTGENRSHSRKRPVDMNRAMRIELARMRAGLTQEQLAKAIGLQTGGAVSHWEKGRHVPNDRLGAIAEATGASLIWLHGEHVVGDAERAFEAQYLRMILDGGPELQELLAQFETPQELIEYLRQRPRKSTEKR